MRETGGPGAGETELCCRDHGLSRRDLRSTLIAALSATFSYALTKEDR